jgi:shikimate 5-dehydrogenase
MYKLALIGGAEVARYTVADKLWELLAAESGIDFQFEILPLANKAALREFWDRYRADPDFVGFNVALPWKASIANLPGINERSLTGRRRRRPGNRPILGYAGGGG